MMFYKIFAIAALALSMTACQTPPVTEYVEVSKFVEPPAQTLKVYKDVAPPNPAKFGTLRDDQKVEQLLILVGDMADVIFNYRTNVTNLNEWVLAQRRIFPGKPLVLLVEGPPEVPVSEQIEEVKNE